MELKRVSKKAIINMFICSAFWAVILLCIAAYIWFGIILNAQPKSYVSVIYWLAITSIELVFLTSPFIRFYRYRYIIDETRIVKKEGLIFITTEMAPIERVHQISIMRGPIDRITGLSKVMATTAGGEITVRFLEQSVAEELASKLESTIKQITKRQESSNEG